MAQFVRRQRYEEQIGFALIISLVLVIGVVLPGTLALSIDQAATNGELTVTEETPTPTLEVTETPTPTEEPKPTETPVPSETEKPSETESLRKRRSLPRLRLPRNAPAAQPRARRIRRAARCM